MDKLKTKIYLARFLLYFVLFLYSLVVLLPLFNIILNSFKDNQDIFTRIGFALPTEFKFDNYLTLFRGSGNFFRYYLNSIVVLVSSTIILLIVASLCSYALAKYKFPLDRLIYFFIIIGLFIPVRLGTINIAQIMVSTNLYDTLYALIIIYVATGIPFSVFILADFIRLIPEELSKSARIDGCSEIGIYYHIILPLIRPALVTVVIFNMVWIWNDIWFPLILIKNEDLRTIQFAALRYVSEHTIQYGNIYAVINIATIPMILIYLFLSRYYIQGATKGAIKG